MSCQGHRHEPFWWVTAQARCKGTKTIKTRALNRKTLQIDIKVGERQCAGRAKYDGYCFQHRQVS